MQRAQKFSGEKQELQSGLPNRREFLRIFSGRSTPTTRAEPVQEHLEILRKKIARGKSVKIVPIAAEVPNVSRRTVLNRILPALWVSLTGWTRWDRASQLVRKFIHREYKLPLAQTIENIKKIFPHIDQWIDSDRWAKAILAACEKNDVPLTTEYLGIILALIVAESGFRISPRVYDEIPSPSEDFIRSLGILSPRTGGPMEESYRHVEKDDQVPASDVQKTVDSIEGGVEYGVKHVKRLFSLYKNVLDQDLRLRCVFADYNAGPFASRNAGFQEALNKVAGTYLRCDGLIRHESKKVLYQVLPLTEKQINQDLKLLGSNAFVSSKTWKAVEVLYGSPILPLPADRPVLGAYGVAKRVLTGVDTSRKFAAARLEEFRQIEKFI